MPFIPLDQAEASQRQGFIPLGDIGTAEPRGFIPLNPGQPAAIQPADVLKSVALENPLTAAAEAAMNFGTQMVAIPAAGVAGLATAGAKAVGLTDWDPATMVHAVGDELTYQPRGEMGRQATEALMVPFEKLAEAGQTAGGKTLETTDSPVLATAVDTAINALPMAIAPGWKAGRAATARGLLNHHPDPSPKVLKTLLRMSDDEAAAYFNAWQADRAAKAGGTNGNVLGDAGNLRRMEADAQPVPRSAEQGLEELRRQGGDDLPAVVEQLPGLPAGRGTQAGAGSESLAGADRYPGQLRAGERGLAEASAADRAPEVLPSDSVWRGNPDDPRGIPASGHPVDDLTAAPASPEARFDAGVAARPSPMQEGLQLDLRGADLERAGIGAEARYPGADVAGTAAPWRPSAADRRTAPDADTVENSTGRAERFLTEKIPAALEVLPDPAKVAELEARNQGDVVLGRRVRDLDDLTLRRWAGMVSLSPRALAKVTREIRRREAEVARPATVALDAYPLAARLDTAAHEAATSPFNNKPQPTPAQVEAGTYAKGHLDLHGLRIAIESPRGSVRSGVDASGRPWQTEMRHHYGYIKRTLAKDGDPMDVFIGDHPSSPRAFVIDQIDPRTGKYDEPKVILGALDEAGARATYAANYDRGWKGLGAITPMGMDAFKAWLKTGDTKKPVGLPRIAGKLVTEFDDAVLGRLQASRTLSEVARERIMAEIARRADPVDAAPVRTQIGEASPAAKAPEVQAMAAGVQKSWAPGQNYAPLIDDAHGPAAPASASGPRPKPIAREEVLAPFMQALGVPIYEGRIKGKKLGHYRPKLEEVRIKRKSDLEVAAHEMAHLIDDRVPAIRAAYQDKTLAAELKAVSYDQKSVKEGFAEFVRLYLTQPEEAAARAPKFNAWMDDFTGRHEYGPAILQAREGMTAWFGQEAIDRARSKIGIQKPINEALDGLWDRLRQSVVDDLHGIYRMERDLKGGELAPAGAYESARLSRASQSITDGALRWGYPVKKPDGSFTFKGQGLEEILKPVAGKLDDTLLYFVGKSASELMGQGREHLFSRGEIDAMLRLRTAERDKAFAEYQAWNKGILDFAEAQGVINPEARRLWQRTQYLPFHRASQPGGIKGKPGDWKGIQALTGGTENLRDILTNMTANAAMLIDKAVKNEARIKIADMAEKTPGGARFMVKIDPEARPVKVAGDQVLAEMFKRYGIGIEGDAPAFFEFLIHGQPPAGANVVAVLKGGKPTWYEVADPLLMRALQAIDRPFQSQVVKWLGLPKRVGQATITLTPDFMLANIARDTLMGSVMSRAGFRPVLDSLQGMRLRLTKDPIYRDYIANGGGLSSIYLDEGKFRAKLEKFYTRQGIDYRTVLDAPDKLLGFIETLGDAFEMSTRLGEYRRAVGRGENPRHAAYLGREVSTDFAMKGDSKALGFLMDVTMFLRPAIVSWDRLARGLAHDPNKGAIAAKAGAMALFSAALYLLNREDPRYADLPDWDRDANWHFFLGDQHFRWPKIWEIGALSSAAERSVEKIMAEDPAGLGKDFARILGATFNLNLMPQILAPLYEQATNRNSFTKAPIETPGMENVQPFLRAKPGTSETMKALGMASRDLPESMQVNPARAEALLRGYFNTWAMYGLMLTDQAFHGDKLPEKRADELPVVRRFYAQEPAKHTRYESEFYDLLAEAKRLRGTLRELDDQGLRTFADQKEGSPLAGEAKPLERAAKNLSGINRDMEAVRRNGDLTPAEKREKLDGLIVERNALVKAAVMDSKKTQKEREHR